MDSDDQNDEPVPLFPGYEDTDYDPSQYDDFYDDEPARDSQARYTGGSNSRATSRNSDDEAVDVNSNRNGPSQEEYSGNGRIDQRTRQGKDAKILNGRFQPAEYEDEDEDAPFLEYSELDSEPLGPGDRSVNFISVPLKIEEVGGRDAEGDPTVILAGSDPEEEEENEDDEDIQPVTVRGVILGRGRRVLPSPRQSGRTKKRVEDIPHSAFHRFLVEAPQGRRTKKETKKDEAEKEREKETETEKEEKKEKTEKEKSKRRGVSDWSQRLREKRRQAIWRQFRLN